MRLIAAALISFLAAARIPAHAQEGEHWDARVAAVTGDVVVRPAGGGEEAAAETGMPLEEADWVVVPEGGSAEVALDGGSLVTIRENSEFEIEKTAKDDAAFFLRIGSLLAKIQKLGQRRLRVRTPTAVAAVRGTEFGVDVAGEDTHVGVFDEGKVEVTGETGPPETLISNQETSVAKGAAPRHAVQLQRFTRHRALMRAHVRRIAVLRAKWKALPAGERRQLRREAMERMRAHRLERTNKRAAFLLQRNADKKRDESKLKERRDWMEKRRELEERRERIRGRGERRDRR